MVQWNRRCLNFSLRRKNQFVNVYLVARTCVFSWGRREATYAPLQSPTVIFHFHSNFQESRAKISCVLCFTVCRAFQPGPSIFVECVIFSEALFHFPCLRFLVCFEECESMAYTFGYLKISEGIRKLCFL